MTKDVFVSRTWEFLREIARLNKKATRIGVPQIVVEDLGKVQKTRHVVTKDEDGNEDVRSVPVEVQHYSLTLPDPADCQWAPIVKITPLENGESFAEPMLAGTKADADAWKDANSQNCDHCHTKRARLISYVVRHKTDGGRVLQLGRNCFQDYVGEDTLAALEFQSVIMVNLGGDEDGFWPMEASGMRSIPIVKLLDCVVLAETLRRTEGWKNNVWNKYNGELEVAGTHRIAADIVKSCGIGDEPSPTAKKFMDKITDADRDAAAAIISRMQDEEVSDEFGETLKNLSDYEWIPNRKASLAAYMGQFLHNIDRKAREAQVNAGRVYRGTVGEREVFENLTCTRCSSVDTDFGTLYINRFEDADSNVLIWKTGSNSFSEGERITLVGTVKEHSEYNGTKQTVLSRCKVLDAEALAKITAKVAKAAVKATKLLAVAT